MLGRHAGADDIDAVQPRFRFNLVDPPPPGEMAVPDLDGEVLAHLPAIENRTDRHADLGGAAQRRVLAPDLGFDAGKLTLGRHQQLLTLACALGRQIAVAANDQPLPREHLGPGLDPRLALYPRAAPALVAARR